MRFRVAAIQDEGLPSSFLDARLWLENWLNGALGDADFGLKDGCVMIVVFSTEVLSKPPPISRLTANAPGGPTLALHIVVEPDEIATTPSSEHLQLLCRKVVRGLPAKPLRKPRELEYGRLREALLAVVKPIAPSAAISPA